MRSSCGALALLVCFLCRAPLLATGTLAVPLTVEERAGVARVEEPVVSGVPLPRAAQIYDPAGLAILDFTTGQVVPADLLPTARWGGAPNDTTKPVKWLLVAFRASVAANGSRSFLLTDYRPAPPPTQIVVTQGPAVWTVDSGAARFELAASGFDLFHRVTVGGVELVSPTTCPAPGDAGCNGPYYMLGDSTYSAAAAQGGSQLAIHRQGSRGQTLTLKIRGAHRTFALGDALLSTDEDLDFATYLTFTAGSSVVRVHHTVGNNRDWTPLANNADFRNIGSAGSVYADEIGLRLTVGAGAAPQWRLATTPSATPLGGLLAETVALYQDSSGDANWDQWKNLHGTGSGVVDTPIYGPVNYVSFRGFEVKSGTTPIGSGDKASGWLDLSGAQGGVMVAVRDFWQNFPKALRVTAGGRLEVALFPAEFRARHTLRVGEQKTHEVLFYFHGPAATDVASVGGGAARPLLALAPAAWYAEITRAVPTVSTTASDVYRFATIPPPPEVASQQPITPQQWDAYLLRHLVGPGVAGYSFAGLDEAVPAAQMLGWMDYGDVPIDFEGQWDVFPTSLACGGRQRSTTGQYGWKYDGDYGLLVGFVRSGDFRFLDYGLPAVRHTADIDYLHHGVRSGRGITSFLDGGTFGHSEHDSDGDLNPHRNGTDPLYDASLASCTGGDAWNGTPTLGMVYGAKGLALGYWLTGEPPLVDALADLGAWVPYMVDNWFDPSATRDVANSLESLTALWQATGEPVYREKAEWIASHSPLLANPLGSGWFASRMADAFGGWVAALRETDDPSEDDRLALVASGAVLLDSYSGDAFRADAYAWAAALLPGDKATHASAADESFASAVRWPAFYGNEYGIGRVWQVKEWVNALRSGHAYQLAKYDQLGGPKVAPAAPTVAPTGGAATQNAAPTAAIAGGASVAGSTGEAVAFDGSPSSDPETSSTALSYLWDFGDGVTATGRTTSHRFAEAGTYAVTLWVSDGESFAVARQSASIAFVNHSPSAAAGSDREVPVGVAVLFDGTASSDPDGQALTYAWDFGDGGLAGGAQPTHAFAAAGVYEVDLTVSDGALGSTDTLVVTVDPVAGASATITLRDGEAGYAGTRDAYLTGRGANWNYGGCDELILGRGSDPDYNFLLAFDLASIPAGARVDGATLTLTARAGNYFADQENQMRLYRLTPSWVEDPPSGGACGASGAAAVSWLLRDGARAWSAAGGDFTDAATGSPLLTVPAGTTAGATVSADVTAIVQAWLLGTPNHGFAAQGATSFQFSYLHASEASAVGSRPALAVTYTPVVRAGLFGADFEAGSVAGWSAVSQ